MDASQRQLVEDIFEQSRRPSAKTWMKHGAFLLATFITTTIAGVLYPFGLIPVLPEVEPQTIPEAVNFILSLPVRYLSLVGTAVTYLFTDLKYLTYGLSFSVSLLFILVSHEMGHYIACRIYKVDATLPFFIPTPPMVGPAGTFGAFIKILSPLPSRKAVFDVGVAGPIAGFIALIPIAVIGVLTMEQTAAPPPETFSGIYFADPLFMRFIAYFAGVDLSLGAGNAFYFAGWVGLLVTALNLIPSGQLDGGHAIFAVFGERVHWWTGRIAFAVMAVLSIVGWLVYNSPSGFLIAVLLAVMLKIRHPVPWDMSPLDTKRKAVAFLTLVIFILCAMPFPIRIS